MRLALNHGDAKEGMSKPLLYGIEQSRGARRKEREVEEHPMSRRSKLRETAERCRFLIRTAKPDTADQLRDWIAELDDAQGQEELDEEVGQPEVRASGMICR